MKHLEWSYLYQRQPFPLLISMVTFFLGSNVSMVLPKISTLENHFQVLKLNVIKKLSSSVRFSENLTYNTNAIKMYWQLSETILKEDEY